jgi:hypothetical protein
MAPWGLRSRWHQSLGDLQPHGYVGHQLAARRGGGEQWAEVTGGGSSCNTKRRPKLQARTASRRCLGPGVGTVGARAGQVAGCGCGVGVQSLGDGLVEAFPREVRGDAEGLGDLLPARAAAQGRADADQLAVVRLPGDQLSPRVSRLSAS